MLDYASLTAVSTVLREGSFERAARVLNVTPSAISQRIKQLEERLGCVLIVRGQPCYPTPVGQLLNRHVDRVRLLEQDLGLALPRLQTGTNRATLRVAVNADSMGTWFVIAISAFAELSPSLLDIVLDDEEHTFEWLKSGAVVAAVTANRQPAPGSNCTALGRLRYVAVASPSFVRKYFADGVSAATLGRAPVLRFNPKDMLQMTWMYRHTRRPVDAPTHWLPSTQGFVDATLAGVGWSMNPASLVERHLAEGSLVELVPGRDVHVPLYWQVARLEVPTLKQLTKVVVTAAHMSLGPAPR